MPADNPLRGAPAPVAAPAPAGTRGWASPPVVVAVVLAIHVGLILDCASKDFLTYDEVGNLAAGVSYWETGSFRLSNVNPPLPKLLAALPVWLSGPAVGSLEQPQRPGHRPETTVGDRFARDNAPRYLAFAFWGRVSGALWAVLAALVLYKWATLLWGRRGGLLALTVWCFEPNVIAHSHLITTDMPVTATGLLAAYLFRSYLLAPSWQRASWAGAALGLGLGCKFTLVVLCPLWVLLWLCCHLVGWPRIGPKPERATALGQFALLVAVSALVLNASFLFSGTGRPLGDYRFVCATLAGPQEEWEPEGYGNRFAESWVGRVPVPLPDDVLIGIDLQRRDFEIYRNREMYLAGEWKKDGWWYYYLYAAALKIPLGVWGLFLISLLVPLLATGRPALPWAELALLALPGVVLFVFVSTQTSLQHHSRYALPALPYWIIFVGRAGQVFGSAPRAAQALAGAALVWAVGSYLALHPFALPYFNELAGGPDRGHEYLLGSNIDWGQDLTRLKEWSDAHPEAQPLRVAYFGHVDPRVVGLNFVLPSGGSGTGQDGPQPGYYAVSVRFVQGQGAAPPNGKGGYQYLPPHALTYFRKFRPIAKAGYSIFIYRLSPEDVNAVRAERGFPPLPSNRTDR
ncbi:MAG TPA: glycosyltransferase family 39 protein [Gemmata sp.]